MTLEEQKLAVCEKLPELITCFYKEDHEGYSEPYWHLYWKEEYRPINWPTEGLQVCHEAEKLLTSEEQLDYHIHLTEKQHSIFSDCALCHATYEQRLEALCRVWWPETCSES